MGKRSWIMICLQALTLSACAGIVIPTSDMTLGDRQVLDMIKHPKKWDQHLITIRVFPFDNGYSESYEICFEQCDKLRAGESPFLIYTERDRFKGFAGNRPVEVKVRADLSCSFAYHAGCWERSVFFTEVRPQPAKRR